MAPSGAPVAAVSVSVSAAVPVAVAAGPASVVDGRGVDHAAVDRGWPASVEEAGRRHAYEKHEGEGGQLK